MERVGNGGEEFKPRPEIDQYGPMGLFEYARAKLEWYMKRRGRSLEAMESLASELNKDVLQYFGHEFPEVIVKASDVKEPHLADLYDGSKIITGKQREADRNTTVTGDHRFSAKLVGFYAEPYLDEETQEEQGVMRVFVQQGPPVIVPTPAGFLPAATSVALEGSDIQFAVQKEADLRHEIERTIRDHANEYDPQVHMLVDTLINVLNDPMESLSRKLQKCSGIGTDLVECKVSRQFIDTITELIGLKLKLDSKVSLKTTSHRISIPSETTRGYRRGGQMTFTDVMTTPEFVLSAAKPFLGLNFPYGEHGELMTVPVNSITEMHRSE